MLDWQLPIYTEILALMVQVEAMKAANKERELLMYSLAYNEKDFQAIADQIVSYSEALRL